MLLSDIRPPVDHAMDAYAHGSRAARFVGVANELAHFRGPDAGAIGADVQEQRLLGTGGRGSDRGA